MKPHTLLILTALLITSCGHHRHGDKMIFRYNESAGIATLDPAFAKDQSIIWSCRQLYNGLIELDTALQVQPAIAKRWEVSGDGLRYTFSLRDDVRFHNGRRVVAEDFSYSFGRIIDPDVMSPGAWIFHDVEGFTALDDTTFEICLKHPFAPFLAQLGMVYCSVVPKEEVERHGKDFRRNPCGTGPFKFQYWKEGVKLVLRRNDDYFEQGLPYLDAVAITFIVDRHTAFLEFIKGNLDFMNSLDASYKDELLTLDGQLKEKYADRIHMHSTPYLNTEYLGFNMSSEGGERKSEVADASFNSALHSPVAALKVRQAISCGFDRRKMMKYLRNNVGHPGVGGFVPLGLPGFDTTAAYGYEYNPTRAAELLAEAGYPHGQGLPRLKLSTTANYLDLCKYLQQQLGLLGIDIQVDVNPPAALRSQIGEGKSAWFRGSWVADYPDAENYLSLFYSGNKAPAGPNYTRFFSPEFDRLYLRARSCTDPQERLALYRTMDSLVMAEAPVMVLYYDQILHFTHKNVSGLRSNAMNCPDLRHVRID